VPVGARACHWRWRCLRLPEPERQCFAGSQVVPVQPEPAALQLRLRLVVLQKSEPQASESYPASVPRRPDPRPASVTPQLPVSGLSAGWPLACGVHWQFFCSACHIQPRSVIRSSKHWHEHSLARCQWEKTSLSLPLALGTASGSSMSTQALCSGNLSSASRTNMKEPFGRAYCST
jgi:hypothetical protein